MSTVKQRVMEAVAAWSYERRWAWTEPQPFALNPNRKVTTFHDGGTPLAGVEWWDDPHGEMSSACILYEENVTDDEYNLWRDGGMNLDATIAFLNNRQGARA